MRKYVLLMFAALALLGCDNEPTPSAPTDPGVISFDKVSTRTSLENIMEDENGFTVYGTVHNDANPNGYWLFNNQKVTYDLNSSLWVYSPVKYWVENTIFSFAAIYPGDKTIVLDKYIKNTENNIPISHLTFDYTTNQYANEDVLWASSIVDTNVADYDRTVNLNFGHLLTKINLKVQKDADINRDDNFIIDKVTLSGVKSSGFYYFIPFNGSLDAQGWVMDGDSETMSFSKQYDGNYILTNSDVITIFDEGLMLIPQAIEAYNEDNPNITKPIAVTIEYRFGLSGNNDVATYEKKVFTAYLPSDEDLEDLTWKPGRSISYTAMLSTSDPIKISAPTIEPWGNLQSGGTIIIK